VGTDKRWLRLISYRTIVPVESGLIGVRSQPVYFTAVYRVTIPDAVIIQFVLLKMSIVLLETC